jgi:hypothetical protein
LNRHVTIDLREACKRLKEELPALQSIWIFGSRRHRTKSVRSDIDLLLCASEHLKCGEVRAAVLLINPALDTFIVEGGKATSCVNDSFVKAETFDQLTQKLDALCIWSHDSDGVDQTAPFLQELSKTTEYEMTTLDGSAPRGAWRSAADDYFQRVQSEGLPTKPFLGHDVHSVGQFLAGLTARVVSTINRMNSSNNRANWQPTLQSEYDFQAAFYLAVKPWLPDLAREEVAIRFDQQEKRSDFSLFENRIIIEMKYVHDAGTKAAVVKTLKGLATFYGQNANVRLVLFLILATRDADVDGARWENDFSGREGSREIYTRVYTLA